MPKIVFLKGLIASGKTSYANELVAKGYKRVNKDDLRAMVDNGKWSKKNEEFILLLQERIIRSYMWNAYDIVIDNTNFEEKHLTRLKEIADIKFWDSKTGDWFEYEIEEKFIDTDVEECIRRDKKREKPVGEKVIYQMYNRYLKKEIEEPKYDPSLWSALIVDIDGTLAKKGRRNIFDFTRVYEDECVEQVADIVRRYRDKRIIILSGRDDSCYEDTKNWLKDNSIPFDYLYMRKTGDKRKDAIVKKEIYDEKIKGKFNIRFVLDDRSQVVKMWREQGLKCFQVANGNF